MTHTFKVEKALGCVFLIILGLTYYRLYFGVDFTDESYYIALPYRFIQGDRPVLDNFCIAQSSAIFLTPFYKIFSFFSSQNNGVILYFRHLYFIFTLGITFLLSTSFKSKSYNVVTLLIASVYLLFIPYGIPNLSYNTLGAGFFSIAVLLMIRSCGQPGPHFFLAGVFQALASVSYPPLVFSSLFFIILVPLFSDYRKLRTFFILLFSLTMTWLLIYLSLEARFSDYLIVLRKVLAHGPSSGHDYEASKFQQIWSQFSSTFPSLFLCFAISALAYLASKKIKKLEFLVVLFYTAVVLYSTRASQGGGGSAHFVLYFVLLTPFLIPLISFDKQVLKYLCIVYLPCLLAGFCMAFASNNVLTASTSVLLVPLAFTHYLIYIKLSESSRYTALIPLLLNLVILARFQSNLIFMDDSRDKLTQKIERGPHYGIKTTPEKAQYYHHILAELQKLDNPKNKISIYPHFPVGYLMTSMRIGTYYIFGRCNPYLNSECDDQKDSNIILSLDRLFYTKNRTEVYNVNSKIEFPNSTKLYSSSDFEIFKISKVK